MENIFTTTSFRFVLSLAGITVHVIGIYALRKMKKRTNQVMILMNLSVSEIIWLGAFTIACLIGLLHYRDAHYEDSHSFDHFRRKAIPRLYITIQTYISKVALCETAFTLVFLTVDRFIHTVPPIKYSIMSEEKDVFKKLIVTSWIFSLLISLLVIENIKILKMITIVLCIATIVIISICYILTSHHLKVFFSVIVFIQSSRRTLSNDVTSQSHGRAWTSRKHQLVPSLIVLTYILFYGGPLVWYVGSNSGSLYFHKNINNFTKSHHIVVELVMCVVMCGMISDALIYVFLTKENRETIIRLFLPD